MVKRIEPQGGLDDQEATVISAFAEQQAGHSRVTGLENQKELDWFRQGESSVYGAIADLLALQGKYSSDEKPARFLAGITAVIKSFVDGLADRPGEGGSLDTPTTWQGLAEMFSGYCRGIAEREPEHSPQFWQLSGMANAFMVMALRIAPERSVSFGPKVPGKAARVHSMRDVAKQHVIAVVNARRVAGRDDEENGPGWLKGQSAQAGG